MCAHFNPTPSDIQRDALTAAAFERACDGPSSGRQEALNDAVQLNLPLAHQIASRYARLGCEYPDLVQVASLGLVKAAARFDPDLGVPFGAFAAPTVRGEVLKHLRDRTSPIRATRPLEELRLRLASIEPSLIQALGREPSVADLATALGVSEQEVRDARRAGEARWTSSIDAARGAGTAYSLADTLGAADPDLDSLEWSLTLERHLADLDDKTRLLLQLRFDEELTQTEIAERLGVSQIQVSRLLRKVLTRLREVLAA
ncbi:MAG: sigma-70 family RNA polymerase sigma factor [Actinomycetales bacterium]|nr:sigma-70 family RNA polymerase sigma factor [Actinomycetales bacterium]